MLECLCGVSAPGQQHRDVVVNVGEHRRASQCIRELANGFIVAPLFHPDETEVAVCVREGRRNAERLRNLLSCFVKAPCGRQGCAQVVVCFSAGRVEGESQPKSAVGRTDVLISYRGQTALMLPIGRPPRSIGLAIGHLNR